MRLCDVLLIGVITRDISKKLSSVVLCSKMVHYVPWHLEEAAVAVQQQVGAQRRRQIVQNIHLVHALQLPQ